LILDDIVDEIQQVKYIAMLIGRIQQEYGRRVEREQGHELVGRHDAKRFDIRTDIRKDSEEGFMQRRITILGGCQ
jgi:hypothetical protein